MFSILACSAAALANPRGASEADGASGTTGGQSLFDGQTLTGWTMTDFAGHGEVNVQDGQLIFHMGVTLTGINWTNPVPLENYEVSLDAKKIEGSDFLCGLTFPVRDSFCTFIVGGWGGGVVGLSSLDGMDASENETTKYMNFETGRWYHIRVRVRPDRLQAWLDDQMVADVVTRGRRISLRYGDIELSKPLGLATYQTTAAMRNIRLQTLAPDKAKKVAMLAGAKSHGPGEHEYEQGLRLFKQCLDTASNVSGVQATVYTNGWPADPHALDDAAAVVLYCDGADRNELAHPLLRDDHMMILDHLMKRGVGFVAIHYTVFVPTRKAGPPFLNWLGGYFDYETGDTTNHWFSKIETRDYSLRPATTNHVILRGVHAFQLHEEYYYHMRFKEHDPRWTPILTFGTDPKDPASVVAWAVERPDGGRAFAYTGGHFQKNWEKEAVRRLMLNAILWTAHADVPLDGVRSSLAETESAGPAK
jgi:type 1 glutamine amidotransferase